MNMTVKVVRTTIQPYVILEQNGHKQDKCHDIAYTDLCAHNEY